MIKMEEGERILALWQEQIDEFPKLKFGEAKKLYQAFLKEESKQEQKKIREEVICGTLHFIGKQIENNPFFFLPNRLFDMNDVINTYVEEWIKQIDTGSLLNIERLSYIFNATFTFNVVANLINKKDNNDFSIPDFPKLLINYVALKKEKGQVSWNDFLDMTGWNLLEYNKIDLLTIYKILETLTNVMAKYEIEIGFTKAQQLKYLLILYARELLQVDIHEVACVDVSKEVIERMYCTQAIKSILDSDLTDREKDVLVMHFGLNDSNSSNYDVIAKKYDVTRFRIMQIEAKALRRLRHPSRLKDIRFWRDK